MKKMYLLICKHIKKNKFIITQIYQAGHFIFYLIILILLLRGLCPVMQKYCEKNIISILEISLVTTKAFDLKLIIFVIGCTIFCLLPFWLLSLQSRFERIINSKVVHQIQNNIIDKIKVLPFEFFHNPKFQDLYKEANMHGGGEILNAVASLSFSVLEFTALLGFTISLFNFSKFSLLVLIILNIPLVISKFLLHKRLFLILKSQSSGRREMDYCAEVLTDQLFLNDIKIYNMYNYFIPRRKLILQKHINELHQYGKKENIISFCVLCCSIISLFLTLIYNINNFLISRINIASFVFIISVSISWQNTLVNLTNTLIVNYNSLLYIDFLLDFLEINVPQQLKSTPVIKNQGHQIVFENVCFSYPFKNKATLKNVNLKFESGNSFCLVGENGSGKTTLLALLLRIYKPTAGKIIFDGKNIEEYNLEEYWKLIGYLPQNFCKYSIPLSVYLNIFNTERICNIYPSYLNTLVACFKQGYNTVLTQRFSNLGEELSGGQWQQLAFYRALIKSTGILICDEPSTFIDSKKEKEIYKILNDYGKKHISVYSTHDTDAWKCAEKLIFIENGKIIKIGSHNDLLHSCAQYNRLYKGSHSVYSDLN